MKLHHLHTTATSRKHSKTYNNHNNTMRDGAEVSLLSANRFAYNEKASDIIFAAANGRNIRTCGKKLLNGNLGLRRDSLFTFIIADIPKANIGAAFLGEFVVLVDVKRKQLVDPLISLLTV
uniref:Uncharacterized protein n=1 Tax=Glossina pallidipes TaxID=7398 RepID=A0A1B0A373_GLOPL